MRRFSIVIVILLVLGGTMPSLVSPAQAASDVGLWSATNPLGGAGDSGQVTAQAVTWTAYNDSAGSSSGNATAYTITSGSTTGLLKNYDTGANTAVTVTFASSGSPSVVTGTYGGAETNSGTDAYTTFHGFADMAGVIQYGSSGWWVDMTFTGLNSAKTYTFATTANRAGGSSGSPTYSSRVSLFTISDVDSATNASTSGVTVVSNEAVAFCTGENTSTGYVARWTGIQPGSDGDFKVRVEANSSVYQAYGPSVFMLQEQDTSPTITTSGTLAEFSTQPGVPSAVQSYTVSGSNLTANISISAPTGFELSTDGTSYSSGLILSQTGGTVPSTTVYVRLNSATEGTFSGNIAHTSAGASDINVPVSGVVGQCLTVSLTATEDTWMRSGYPTYNYGGAATLSHSPRNSAPHGSLIKWDLSSIPAAATVSAASLTFYVSESSAYAFSLYDLKRSWVEGTSDGTASSTSANWNTYDGSNSWGTSGAAGSADRNSTNLWDATTSTFGTTGSVTIPLNASGVTAVQGWVNGSSTNYGLTIQNYSASDTSGDYWIVASSEATTAANRPQLNITYCAATGPTIMTSGSLTPFSAAPGLPSEAQSYTVSGTGLTDDIEIAAPAGFELSEDGTNYFASLTLIQEGGVVGSTAIYVRLYSAVEGTFGGDIAHESPGATMRVVAVSGTVSLCSEVSLVAAEDTYLSSVNQSNNYGGVNLFKVSSQSSTNRGALLRWDLSSIPADATVSSASLTLYVSTAASQTYNLYKMRRSWVEGTTNPGASSTTSTNWTTYNGTNTWGTNGAANTTSDRFDTNLWGAGSTTFSATGSKTVELNASGIAAVQEWISDAANNFGVTIQNYSGSSSSNDLQISSSENATAANRPVLNITYCASSSTPTIATAGTLSGFSSSPGVPSAAQSYTVAGTNLTGAIAITAPADFEISLASGSGFGSTLSLTPSGGSVPATTIYVRFNRATAGSSSGSIAHTSEGATARNVAVSGTAANQAPAQPVLVQPANGGTSTSTSPVLEVTVTDPESDVMSVSFYGREVGTTDACADFSVYVIPDTQNMSTSYPAVFNSMTQYIANNKASQDIAFATHVGDLVNTASSTTEWTRADTAMGYLDTAGVAYSVGPGNHDLGGLYETYFGIARFSGKPWYGGYYGSDNLNNYSLFSAGGMDFIVINLQYSSTADHYDWADGLLKAYPSRRGIVVKHDILNTDNSWNNQAPYTALKDNPNLFLMLCGHMHTSTDGSAYIAGTGDSGQTIHILMTDYQDYPNGGNGYLRKLRFAPAEDKIYSTIYSPYIDSYLTSASNYEQCELAYDMECSGGEGAYTLLGTVNNVASGTNASVSWADLTEGTEYEWYVTVSDGGSTTTGTEWTFTAGNLAQELDFGDAPDPTYPTLLANDGARHVIVPGFYLGDSIDAEADGQQDDPAAAQGDDNDGNDDEDGVTFSGTLVAGSTAQVAVVASAAGVLNAWLDFNADGDWADAGEQIFVNEALVSGPNGLTFQVPASATAGYSYARFRFSSASGLSYTGLAPDGEVEDYWVSIEAAPVQYNLTVGTAGNGTVTLNPSGGTYTAGTTVTLTPVPNSGYVFDGWSGANATDVVYAGGVYTIVMDSNKAVTAQFVAQSALLGGVNGDGVVDSTDALIILSCDVGIDTSQFCPMNCGDVNADGLIDSTDALIVLSYNVGISVPYAVGGGVCPTNVTPCAGCGATP